MAEISHMSVAQSGYIIRPDTGTQYQIGTFILTVDGDKTIVTIYTHGKPQVFFRTMVKMIKGGTIMENKFVNFSAELYGSNMRPIKTLASIYRGRFVVYRVMW